MSNALINFYHNLKEPIIIYDKKSDVLYHNLSFRKMFGEFNNLSGVDFTTCDITGIKMDYYSMKMIKINSFQCRDLIGVLGVEVIDE